DRVVVCHQGAVGSEEVEEMRHLLEIGLDTSCVPQVVRVVEDQVDHMLDRSAEAAGVSCRLAGSGADCSYAGDTGGQQRERYQAGDRAAENGAYVHVPSLLRLVVPSQLWRRRWSVLAKTQ